MSCGEFVPPSADIDNSPLVAAKTAIPRDVDAGPQAPKDPGPAGNENGTDRAADKEALASLKEGNFVISDKGRVFCVGCRDSSNDMKLQRVPGL